MVEARKAATYRNMYAQKQQADEKTRKEEDERVMDAEAKKQEIEYVLSNPFMGENPAVAISRLDPRRVRPDHWKGMSQGELDDIRAMQQTQREARLERNAADAHEEQEYAALRHSIAATMTMRAVEVEMIRKTEKFHLSHDLKEQIEEKEARDAHLRQVYTNPPDASFFTQFGTTSR